MTTTERVLYERRLEKIFDMLLLGMTNVEIASHLQITIRAVHNYKRKLESRYMQYQQQKNINTWALELNLLRNRLLTLYRNLDMKIRDDRTDAASAARAADVAMKIANGIASVETNGIGAIQEMTKLAKQEEARITATTAVDEFEWIELSPEEKKKNVSERYLRDATGRLPGQPGYNGNRKF